MTWGLVCFIQQRSDLLTYITTFFHLQPVYPNCSLKNMIFYETKCLKWQGARRIKVSKINLNWHASKAFSRDLLAQFFTNPLLSFYQLLSGSLRFFFFFKTGGINFLLWNIRYLFKRVATPTAIQKQKRKKRW